MACSIGEGILGIWNVGGSKYRQMFRFFFSQFAFSWIHKCLFAKYSDFSSQIFSTPTMLILRYRRMCLTFPICPGVDRPAREVESAGLPTCHLCIESDTGLVSIITSISSFRFIKPLKSNWNTWSLKTLWKVKPRSAPLAQDDDQEEGGYAVPRWSIWISQKTRLFKGFF